MPDLNGQPGVIVSTGANEQGRWEVEVKRDGDIRRLSLKPCNLRWAGVHQVSQQQPPTQKFNGLSALVSSQRPGGEVEFSKMLSLKPENFEVLSSGSTSLQRGVKVKVNGLRATASYNGLIGVVRSASSNAGGRWEVEVSRSFCMRQEHLEVKPGAAGLEVKSGATPASQNLFSYGTNVMLHGLKKADYNGEWGTVTSYEPSTDGRWEVEIMFQGEEKKLLLKPENIAPEVAG